MLTPLVLGYVWSLCFILALFGAGLLLEHADTSREELVGLSLAAICLGVVAGWQNDPFMFFLPFIGAGLLLFGYFASEGLHKATEKVYLQVRMMMKALLYPVVVVAYAFLVFLTIYSPLQAAVSGAALALFAYFLYGVVKEWRSRQINDWNQSLWAGIVIAVVAEGLAIELLAHLIH